MRTLSRPMFNMGGPIKQGIMNGIREPYRGGGKAALVGNPVYPKTDGREHHFAVSGTIAGVAGLNAARIAAQRAAMRYGPRALNWARKTALPRMKSWFGKTTPGSVTRGTYGSSTGVGASGSYSPVTMNPSKFNPNWLGRDPIVQGLGWAGKSIFSPTAGGLASKALRGIFSPSGIALGAGWYLWPDGSKRKTPPPTNVPLNPNLQGTIKAAKELSKKKTKEFALQQRNERVEKYLKMMGYDQAKKTAIADALIDASKIVGDRGTLDLKNIGRDLINPIIQATSKRLDKPDQIREAVGLMSVKAEIEKDLEDPSIKALRMEQLKQLKGGFAKDMGDFVLSAKGAKVKPKALERYARATANEHKLNFKVVTDEDIAGLGEDASIETIIQTAVKGDGVYMIGDAVIQVIDGVPKQIV